MEPIFEQFKKAKRAVHLGKDRQAEIRENLMHFIETYEVINEPKKSRSKRSYFISIGAGFVITALIGGGTALASERSVPGDLLYAIKIKVVEPTITALPLSTEVRANWEVRLAERRLEEATVLAQIGNLQDGAEQELNDAFKNHIEEAQKNISELEDRGREQSAASIASRLEGSIDAHGQIISVLKNNRNSSDTENETGFIRNIISEKLNAISETRLQIEDKIKDKKDLEIAKASEERIKSVSKIIKNESNSKNENEKASSTLSDTLENKFEKILEEAQQKQESKKYGEAFNLANQALREARTSKIINDVKSKLKINVSDFYEDDWRIRADSRDTTSNKNLDNRRDSGESKQDDEKSRRSDHSSDD